MNGPQVRLLLPLPPAMFANVLLRVFDALGKPMKPSAVHDPAAPTGCVGTFPCQVKYDPRGAPTRAKSSRWVESMLGRSQFNPPPTVQESVAVVSAQPHVSDDSFRHIPPPHAIPPLPTPGIQPHQSQYHAGYIPGGRVDGDGQGGNWGTSNPFGTGSGVPPRGANGPPPPSGGGDGWGYIRARVVTRSRQMIALAMFRTLMILIVSVVAVALPELELGTAFLADSAAVRIVVVIRSTFAASALSELPVLHAIRPPKTLEVMRAMVEGIERLSVSLLSLIPSRNRRDSDAGLVT